MAKTVKDIFNEMNDSLGFVLFASFIVKKEDGTLGLEHRYMSQQFVPEDLEKAFQEFGQLLSKHMADSGMNLLKSAENIVNQKFPIDGTAPGS